MDHFIKAKAIVKKLQSSGHIAYFAGGWVRDYLLDHPSDDIDIVTDATTDEVALLFEKTIPVGVQFGIIIIVDGDHHFETAMFRKETGYEDGRRPSSIEPASPEQDAQRRDFTINGLFYDPITEKIYDYVDGKKDLKKKIIKAIGNPLDRFNEDRLRMIRAIRYSARFHFEIETKTKEAIQKLKTKLFPSVAIERVYNEFEKMAKFSNFHNALISLHDVGLLSEIFPDLKKEPSIDHLIINLIDFPPNAPLIAKLLELFPSYTHKEKLKLADRFKLSNKDREFIEYYTKTSNLLELPSQEVEPYDLAYLYANPHFEICLSIFSLKCLPEKKSSFVDYHINQIKDLDIAIHRIRTNDPLLKAKHLIDRGIKPGPKLGALLKDGEKLSINQSINDLDVILKHLKI